jgi:hypothetical protein
MKRTFRNHLRIITSSLDDTRTLSSEALGGDKGDGSNLYFIECKTQLVATDGDTTTFATKAVTIILMSFTNVDISIAVPGRGMTLVGPW